MLFDRQKLLFLYGREVEPAPRGILGVFPIPFEGQRSLF
jgi:hypothetical protein